MRILKVELTHASCILLVHLHPHVMIHILMLRRNVYLKNCIIDIMESKDKIIVPLLLVTFFVQDLRPLVVNCLVPIYAFFKLYNRKPWVLKLTKNI